MLQRVNPLLGMHASSTILLIQFCAVMPGTAVDEQPSTWVPATVLGAWMELRALGFSLVQHCLWQTCEDFQADGKPTSLLSCHSAL